MVKKIPPVSPPPNENPLFTTRVKLSRIGSIQPRRNLRFYVRWAEYIQIQRKRKLLLKSLKIPPALNPFYSPLSINLTYPLFRLLRKYKPESRSSKCARLKALSEAIISKKVPSSSPKPVVLKFGLKHVTSLVEKGLAKLVVIARDVDPIELVVWLPSLCEAMSVPYCIIKNKDRLGKLTGTKTCTTIALTEVRQEDQSNFDQLVLEINKYFTNDTYLKRWKYPEMGYKRSEKLRIIHEKLYKKWSIKYSIEF